MPVDADVNVLPMLRFRADSNFAAIRGGNRHTHRKTDARMGIDSGSKSNEVPSQRSVASDYVLHEMLPGVGKGQLVLVAEYRGNLVLEEATISRVPAVVMARD